MSFLDTISDGFKSVVHVGEDIVKGAEGAVEGALGSVVSNPLNLLNPLAIAEGAAKGAISNISSDHLTNVLKAPYSPVRDFSNLVGNVGGDNEVVGGSVEAILMQIAARDRARLTHKVFELKNLQAPGEGATEQQVNDYNTQKTSLMADIQSLQEEVQQTTTMATNISKSENDTTIAIDRNI